MSEQIPGRHALSGKGIVHFESGKIVSDRLIPLQFALIDQDAQSRCCEGFCARGDSEEGVGCYVQILSDIAFTKALRKDELAIFDNSDSQAGQLPILHCGLYEF